MLSKPLLTVHEVADLLKVKEATVRRWIRSRALPAIEFKREYRVPAIHLERFVADRLTVPSGAPGEPVGTATAEQRPEESDQPCDASRNQSSR